MIVVCPACQARFQYDDNRFGAARIKRFKCPKCSHVFEVANPALALVTPQEPLPLTITSPAAPENEPTPPAPIPAARLSIPIGPELNEIEIAARSGDSSRQRTQRGPFA